MGGTGLGFTDNDDEGEFLGDSLKPLVSGGDLMLDLGELSLGD